MARKGQNIPMTYRQMLKESLQCSNKVACMASFHCWQYANNIMQCLSSVKAIKGCTLCMFEWPHTLAADGSVHGLWLRVAGCIYM